MFRSPQSFFSESALSCWLDEKNDRLVLGGSKAYFGEEENGSKHQAELAKLPEWDITSKVILQAEYRAEQENTIKGKIEEAFGYFRRPCCICGGWTKKISIVGSVEHELISGYVCDECLKLSADQIKTTLLNSADSLEQEAKALRIIAEFKWSLPTYEEWQAETDKHNEEVRRYYEEEEGYVFQEGEVVGCDAEIPF